MTTAQRTVTTASVGHGDCASAQRAADGLVHVERVQPPVTVNGSASSDPDGTIASYAWNYGDGGTATGATRRPTSTPLRDVHRHAHGDRQRRAQASSTLDGHVAAPPGPTVYATDAFGRTAANGLGTADTGGAWTVTGGAANFSVGSGAASLKAPLGGTLTGYLNGVSTTDSDVRAQLSIDKVPTGTGTYASVYGRTVGTGTYGAKLRFYPTGAVTLQASGGSAIVLPGLTYSPGEQLQVRVQVTGTSPTTTRAKVWRVGELEPTTWQVSGTDSAAAMQAAGGVAIQLYLPTSATNAPVTGRFDNLYATASQ